jgi:D-threo-aldose 1-dehydrogenase
MRSVEDSLQRLALERIDIVFIHDIDTATHGAAQQRLYFEQAMEDGWRALAELRAAGVIRAAGVGVNDWESCYEALQRQDIDCFLLAGRYTLLEQGALDQLLPLWQERSVAVVVGGGFNSGILATGAVEGARFNYAPAPEQVMTHVRRLETVCQRYGVPLKAAALQFVLGHPAIPTTIPGVRTVSQLSENLKLLGVHIPSDFWEELKETGLLRSDAPVPR